MKWFSCTSSKISGYFQFIDHVRAFFSHVCLGIVECMKDYEEKECNVYTELRPDNVYYL